jgi:CheY-like chemotaxis protein
MKVLLVEDHQLAAKIADYILRSLDCQVDIAKTGEQALEKVTGGHYDLVLMDLGLPDKSGYEVTQILRQRNESIPVYALTAYTDQDHKNRAFEAGMNGFLSKPLEESEVKVLLEEASQVA